MIKLAANRLAVVIFVVIAGVVIRVDGDADWWKTTTIYEVWPRSFKDSNGDGIGDLNGITSKLDYLKDLGVETVWIAPFLTSPQVDSGFDVSNYFTIDPMYGTLEDFDNLITRANELGLKVIIDYVPNHTSTEHEWFKLSEEKVDPYTDYYVWNEGTLDADGVRQPPNNWLSVFGGSAWEWSDKRQAYYLHQFRVSQADLDFRNELVVQKSKDILTHWLDRGVAGFVIGTTRLVFEDAELRDEPESGVEGSASTDYSYLSHIYTLDNLELYSVVQQWGDHLKEYSVKADDDLDRIIIIDSYANISMINLYYLNGADFPFNNFLIGSRDVTFTAATQTAADIKDAIDLWMNNLPEDATPNWIIGNHDRSRVATRYGSEKVDAINFLLLLLPGVATIYNGEEIGMTDTFLTWEETEDPQACNTDSTRYTRFSRDPERTPFQWDTTTSAGFSTNTSTYLKVNENYLTLNLEAQKAADRSHYKNFKAAMQLRKSPVAQEGILTASVIDENILAVPRELQGYDPFLVLINWADTSVTVSLDHFTYFSDDLEVLLANVGSDVEVGSTVYKSSITLAGNAALVLA